ncbi:MAG: hypothetical protein ACE3L7_32865 [Candidatus Pristimantibacillus sp.]
MVAGIIGILSQIGFVVGVALISLGFVKGSEGEGPYNWKAVINGSLIIGLFLVVVCLYWLYKLTGRFLFFF